MEVLPRGNHQPDLGLLANRAGLELPAEHDVRRSTDATVTFPAARGKAGNYYRSYFRYAKYIHWYCDTVACGAGGYTIRPYSWERGTQVTTGVRVPEVKRDNCSPYKKGSTDNSRGSKAVTWTNGVSIGGDLASALGLNIALSSQTGFTSSARERRDLPQARVPVRCARSR